MLRSAKQAIKGRPSSIGNRFFQTTAPFKQQQAVAAADGYFNLGQCFSTFLKLRNLSKISYDLAEPKRFK